jgi:prepilin-type N-terminal cleavage/methylation domain-containing protein
MKRGRGFTLVELLVVIAIIAILASIVVPRVAIYISKARMTAARTEINGIELALTKVLTDTSRRSFLQLFQTAAVTALAAQDMEYQVQRETEMMYTLLRQGRDAELPLLDSVRGKLGETYMDVPRDPWDNLYLFYAGPWKGTASDPTAPVPFRCWRPGFEDVDNATYDPYEYIANDIDMNGDTVNRKIEADTIGVPGNPPLDGEFGFPAPDDFELYIWSMGENFRSDQAYPRASASDEPTDEFKGGGDDINNWDNESGWERFYN